ncbi:cytochrome P450 3A11-like isoform X2 [Argopecten irradians]|uniref:cytochrome P450 3A11-like isoform X2 n=1 Tax=Argopecten irradians TaxID=31199 RepID=UPI00371D07C1
MEIVGFDIPGWILITLCVLLYTYLMSRDFLTFWRMGIPGPTPRPILGNIALHTKKGVRAFDKEGIKKYGKVFGFYDMISTNLVVTDKEMMKEILVKQFNNFPDRRGFVGGFSGDLEHSLLNVKGEKWKHDRSIISPTFSSGKLRKMVPSIQESCKTLMKTCRNSIKIREDRQVEMKGLFGGFTMDVISSTAFGVNIDSQGNPDDPFIKHAKRMFDFTINGLWTLLVMLFPPLSCVLVQFGIYAIPGDSMAYFRKFTMQLVEERKGRKEVGRTDFLQLMVNSEEGHQKDENERSDDRKEVSSKQKGMTFDEILANAEVFFVAGYETTAITLTMMAYNLATNPECQDMLRQEIEEKIGSKPVDAEDIQELKYLDMCLNETLRMFPPALRLERRCVKTTTLKGITIPAGMVVIIPIYAIHHDPDIWEKPDVFNPERFSASEKAKHDSMDFLPFGNGPRNCIGMRLALTETKLAIANFVRNFRMSVGTKTDIPPLMDDVAILKPYHMWLQLEEIEQTNE